MKRKIFRLISFVAGASIALVIVFAAWVVGGKLIGQQNGEIDITELSIYGLEKTLELYTTDHDGKFPNGTEEVMFKLLTEPPNMLQPYLEKPLTDGWGNRLKYEYPTDKRDDGKPAIWSVGNDGISETADDITNWEDIIQ